MSMRLLVISAFLGTSIAFATGEVPVDKTCKSFSARDQCNLGLTCSVLGGDCQRCTTSPTARWKRCVEEEGGNGCLLPTGDSAQCGARIVGSCASDGTGGLVCIGFPAGDCGTLVNECGL